MLDRSQEAADRPHSNRRQRDEIKYDWKGVHSEPTPQNHGTPRKGRLASKSTVNLGLMLRVLFQLQSNSAAVGNNGLIGGDQEQRYGNVAQRLLAALKVDELLRDDKSGLRLPLLGV